MPATYEPIATQTLGSSAAMVTFSSIPSSFTDLVLVGTSRATAATFNNNAYALVRVNSDSGANYSYTTIFTRSEVGSWYAASFREASRTSFVAGPVPTNGHTSGIFGTIIVQVMSYANTNAFKTILDQSGYSSNLTNHDGPRRGVGLWRSTSAISSLAVSLTDGDFTAGTEWSLYGIKAA